MPTTDDGDQDLRLVELADANETTTTTICGLDNVRKTTGSHVAVCDDGFGLLLPQRGMGK
jgi:hypothetical protein